MQWDSILCFSRAIFTGLAFGSLRSVLSSSGVLEIELFDIGLNIVPLIMLAEGVYCYRVALIHAEITVANFAAFIPRSWTIFRPLSAQRICMFCL